MKKNYMFAVALAAAALTGCSQDELAEFSPESKSGFTAMLETVDTRTVLDESNKVQWVKTVDHVSLFEKVDINAKYQVSNVDDKGTAILKYVSYIENDDYQSLDKYYAVYPYSDDNSIASDGTITAPVSDTYTFTDKASSINSALMVASSDNKQLRFTNAQGILRVKLNAETPYIWGKIQSVSFTSRTKYLNGTATMSWEGTETPSAVIATGTEENKTLTIHLTESLKKNLPSSQSGNFVEYYVPVVPAQFEANDLTMVVTFANNKTYSKSIGKNFSIARKEIIGLKHTIGADDFSADIEDEVVSDEVANEAQLVKALQAGIQKSVSITLLNNITLTEPWTPIGDKEKGEYFTGTLNGNGYTISGLNVTTGDYVSLISAAKDATIKNLTVSGSVNGDNAAGIVARVEGTTVIENCVNNVAVTGTTKAGGIVSNVTNTGENTVQIINCVNNAAISCDNNKAGGVGGIIGYVNSNATVTVKNCINNGNVTGNNNQTTGAIIGYAAGNSNGVIEGFENTGTVSGKNYVGDGNGRWLQANGVVVAGYCGTPANWSVKYTGNDGCTYYVKEGKLTLAKVPTTYTEAIMNIPEGVNALGNKLLQGNTTIKEVVIPAGLTDFGGTANSAGTGASGGFFNGSSVEKITLSEGLTEIPAAAFNGANNLKEVNIPTTVTTIGINAFAYTGLEKLIVPSTVTNIGYGAFRGMNNLTTVTIEGNVDIPHYAFRSCVNLRTVIITGNNVTFGGGSKGMIFTNYDTGDGKAITINVANETVKQRLLESDLAATTYGGYTIVVGEVKNIENSNEFSTALSNGGAVNLAPGQYTLPAVNNSNVMILGDKNTVITINTPGFGGSNVTLNGVTVKGSGYATGIQHVNKVTYNDVTIQGEMCLYGEKVVFNNCVFELNGQYIWTYGAKVVEFNNCTFNTTGKAILVYNEGAGASNVTVKGCTFNASASAKAGAIANQNCAAIEIDNFQSSGTGAAHVLTTEGNTYSNNFSGEWRIKSYTNGNSIKVNNVTYNSIAIDGKLMTIDANKNVTIQ